MFCISEKKKKSCKSLCNLISEVNCEEKCVWMKQVNEGKYNCVERTSLHIFIHSFSFRFAKCVTKETTRDYLIKSHFCINNVTILQYIYIYLYILYIYRQFIRVVSFTVACNKFVSYCSFASIEQRFRLVAICYHNDNNNTINVN